MWRNKHYGVLLFNDSRKLSCAAILKFFSIKNMRLVENQKVAKFHFLDVYLKPRESVFKLLEPIDETEPVALEGAIDTHFEKYREEY
jgi:hypothetical protein